MSNTMEYSYFSPHQSTAYNPLSPEFQPTGSGIERHPQTVVKPTFDDMQWQINNLQYSLRADLQVLHNTLQQLQSSERHAGSYTYRYDDEEQQAALLRQEVAETYLQEACNRERSAFELRRQAGRILKSKGKGRAAPAPKLLEAPSTKPTGFACCENDFDSLGELLAHASAAHGFDQPASANRRSPTKSIGTQTITATTEAAVRTPIEKKQAASQWTPDFIRNLKPFAGDIPQDHSETFSHGFLQELLRCNMVTPGFYFDPNQSELPSKSYYLLTRDVDHFLPSAPGHHGAKIVPFMKDIKGDMDLELENYIKVPLFVQEKGTSNYRYFGNYSQSRFSDMIGYDTAKEHLSDWVLRYWADQLADPTRPEWVTHGLTKHFWQMPLYQGPIPTDPAIKTPATTTEPTHDCVVASTLEQRVRDALEAYVGELTTWRKETDMKAKLLTSDSIYKSFSTTDVDDEPGMRLYWEYLECVDYDVGFYEYLCKLKNNPALINPSRSRRTACARDLQNALKRSLTPGAVSSDEASRATITVTAAAPKPRRNLVDEVLQKKQKDEKDKLRAARPTEFVKLDWVDDLKAPPKQATPPPSNPKSPPSPLKKPSVPPGYVPPHLRARKSQSPDPVENDSKSNEKDTKAVTDTGNTAPENKASNQEANPTPSTSMAPHMRKKKIEKGSPAENVQSSPNESSPEGRSSKNSWESMGDVDLARQMHDKFLNEPECPRARKAKVKKGRGF